MKDQALFFPFALKWPQSKEWRSSSSKRFLRNKYGLNYKAQANGFPTDPMNRVNCLKCFSWPGWSSPHLRVDGPLCVSHQMARSRALQGEDGLSQAIMYPQKALKFHPKAKINLWYSQGCSPSSRHLELFWQNRNPVWTKAKMVQEGKPWVWRGRRGEEGFILGSHRRESSPCVLVMPSMLPPVHSVTPAWPLWLPSVLSWATGLSLA